MYGFLKAVAWEVTDSRPPHATSTQCPALQPDTTSPLPAASTQRLAQWEGLCQCVKSEPDKSPCTGTVVRWAELLLGALHAMWECCSKSCQLHF